MKIELSDHSSNSMDNLINTVPTVKQGDGGIILWGFFYVAGPDKIVRVAGKLDTSYYGGILREYHVLRVLSISGLGKNLKHTKKKTHEF